MGNFLTIEAGEWVAGAPLDLKVGGGVAEVVVVGLDSGSKLTSFLAFALFHREKRTSVEVGVVVTVAGVVGIGAKIGNGITVLSAII